MLKQVQHDILTISPIMTPFLMGDDFAPAPSSISFLKYLFLNLDGFTEIDTVGEANIIGTGRIEPVHNPVVTEIALLSYSAFFIKRDCMIRTGLYATTAAGET